VIWEIAALLSFLRFKSHFLQKGFCHPAPTSLGHHFNRPCNLLLLTSPNGESTSHLILLCAPCTKDGAPKWIPSKASSRQILHHSLNHCSHCPGLSVPSLDVRSPEAQLRSCSHSPEPLPCPQPSSTQRWASCSCWGSGQRLGRPASLPCNSFPPGRPCRRRSWGPRAQDLDEAPHLGQC
jgi:hypothetical protein